MIESKEEVKKLCTAFFLEDPQVEREQLIDKLEDCLDLVAAVQAVNEVSQTAEVSDWDDFEKELDALDKTDP